MIKLFYKVRLHLRESNFAVAIGYFNGEFRCSNGRELTNELVPNRFPFIDKDTLVLVEGHMCIDVKRFHALTVCNVFGKHKTVGQSNGGIGLCLVKIGVRNGVFVAVYFYFPKRVGGGIGFLDFFTKLQKPSKICFADQAMVVGTDVEKQVGAVADGCLVHTEQFVQRLDSVFIVIEKPSAAELASTFRGHTVTLPPSQQLSPIVIAPARSKLVIVPVFSLKKEFLSSWHKG